VSKSSDTQHIHIYIYIYIYILICEISFSTGATTSSLHLDPSDSPPSPASLSTTKVMIGCKAVGGGLSVTPERRREGKTKDRTADSEWVEPPCRQRPRGGMNTIQRYIRVYVYKWIHRSTVWFACHSMPPFIKYIHVCFRKIALFHS